MKALVNGSRLILKSLNGFEILDTKIYQDKFIVAHTTESLLVGHLESCSLSEIEWHGSPDERERFVFDNDQVITARLIHQ